MLLAAGAIYLILGDRTEAIVLLSSVLVVITISLFQNRRTERALQALAALARCDRKNSFPGKTL